MDRQIAFNRIWDHFVTNKADPSSVERNCKYRGPNGTKCVVGCLINDDLYTEEIEGANVNCCKNDFNGSPSLVKKGVLLKTALEQSLNTTINDDDLKYLFEMQQIHDSYIYYHSSGESDKNFTAYMSERLTNYAEERRLTVPTT